MLESPGPPSQGAGITSRTFFRWGGHALGLGRRVLLPLLLGLAGLGLAACSSVPTKNDPRLPAELSRTLGVAPSEFLWVAAVHWSRHDGWWQPNLAGDMWRGTLGMLFGEETSTAVLTRDALVIARSGSFSVSYRVQQRIGLDEIERVTLLDRGIVVLKRRNAGERRDYLRVLRSDPWLADQFLDRPSPGLAQDLAQQLRARVRPAASRWRPDTPAQDAARVVALLTPRAVPRVTVAPPPGSADKGAVAGTGAVAKELLGAGEGIGTLSPPAGLSFGLAALVAQAAGSLAGAVRGTVQELSDAQARAARARLEAVRRAGLPATETGTFAQRVLLESLATRIAPVEAGASDDRSSILLVAVDEAETGAPDPASARAALAEDGFAAVWQLQVTSIEFHVVSAGTSEPVDDPRVQMRVGVRLQKTRAGAAPGPADEADQRVLEDAGEALALSAWTSDGGDRLRAEFGAACDRLAARLVDGALTNSRWLPRLR